MPRPGDIAELFVAEIGGPRRLAKILVPSAYRCTHRERGKLRSRYVVKNLRTVVGANYLLDVGFKNGTRLTSWYLGLIAAGTDVAVSEDDTMSSHAGWTEFQSYSGGARGTWSAGTQAGGMLGPSAATTFTFTANGALRGLFLVSNSTLGGTTGTLYSAGLEDADRLVNNTDTLDVEYTTNLVAVSG